MAYADASPAEIEKRLKPKPKSKLKRKRRTMARAPSEASIWPRYAFAGAARKLKAAMTTMFRKLGEAIAAGLLDPPKKPEPTPVDPLLWAIDRARRVRELVGRVDVSGDNDGASWAKLVQGPRGRELHVYYRHGREVLAELMAAVEAVITAAGGKIRALWKRIERARQFGGQAFVAVIPLAA